MHDDLTILVDRRSPMPLYAQVAEEFGVPRGEPVLFLERLRLADDKPLALLRNWLPPDLVSVTDEELERRGLYELIRQRGWHLQVARQRIGARGASAVEAKL